MSIFSSLLSPKPRYRFYGSPNTYVTALQHAKDLLTAPVAALRGLEEEVSRVVDVPHAVCVPQARFGIYLALKAMISPGQKVIMSPYTIYDVVNMVLCAGGQPVFADIEEETCNIDPARIEELIDGDTGAVMVTHLHGLACDMERISDICKRRNVPLFEDAAQAFGARSGGRHVGSFGQAGVYSFGRAKNINAFYGGMVVTRDQEIYEAVAAELATFPYEDTGKLVKRIGHCLASDMMTLPAVFSPLTFRVFRYAALNNVRSINQVVQTENNPVRREDVPAHYQRRMTPLQARIAREQLADVENNTLIRLGYAERYHEGLEGMEGLRLPPRRPDGSHIYLQYPIQVEDRWDLVRYMMRHGRDVAVQHMNSAAELDVYSDFYRDCPVARRVSQSVVLLPTYPRYGADQVERNIEVIAKYFGR